MAKKDHVNGKHLMVFPGTFDPFTNGHISIVERALFLCDELHVAVFDNSRKTPVMSRAKRTELVRTALCHLPEVKVRECDSLLVDYCQRNGITWIIRGVHGPSSFEEELTMADINRLIGDGIETVFLPSIAKQRYVSSSIVREIARLGGDITGMVPKTILHDVERAYRTGQAGYDI
ncbi:MAG: pantetheine-phosphate adenylyltransferase [Clostridiaceae bacterium]|nr:pantetheine-phosphate adenylyltransferase [Clostridiaceae bacterium]